RTARSTSRTPARSRTRLNWASESYSSGARQTLEQDESPPRDFPARVHAGPLDADPRASRRASAAAAERSTPVSAGTGPQPWRGRSTAGGQRGATPGGTPSSSPKTAVGIVRQRTHAGGFDVTAGPSRSPAAALTPSGGWQYTLISVTSSSSVPRGAR